MVRWIEDPDAGSAIFLLAKGTHMIDRPDFNWEEAVAELKRLGQQAGIIPREDSVSDIQTADVECGPFKNVPSDSATRKSLPLCSGVLDYFPLALVEVALVSRVGNDQHNPGEQLHWARSKSTDHADCIARHLLDRGSIDVDGMRHTAKLAWRALALLQEELEATLATLDEVYIPTSGHDTASLGDTGFYKVGGSTSADSYPTPRDGVTY